MYVESLSKVFRKFQHFLDWGIVVFAAECGENEFTCDGGQCFERDWLCAGMEVCADGTDMEDCENYGNPTNLSGLGHCGCTSNLLQSAVPPSSTVSGATGPVCTP